MSSLIDSGSYFDNGQLNRLAYFPDKAVSALFAPLVIVMGILIHAIISEASAHVIMVTVALLVPSASIPALAAYATNRRQNAENLVLCSLASDYYDVIDSTEDSYSPISTDDADLVKRRLRALPGYFEHMRRNKQVVSRSSFDQWHIVNSS